MEAGRQTAAPVLLAGVSVDERIQRTGSWKLAGAEIESKDPAINLPDNVT
jgi:hypothetical protein